MPATTSHLNPAIQSDALDLRLSGASYASIAATLGLANANAAMYAAEVACNARYGATDRIRRFTRTATAQASNDPSMLFLNRRFGIEIEYNCGRAGINPRTAAQALVAAGLNAHHEGYNHATVSYWKSTTDATVTGGEMVSPILQGEAGWVEFKTAMEALRTAGAVVARNTGGHVHHDVNDLDTDALRNLVINLRHTQDALLAYVPAHRYDGSNSCGATKITPVEWAAIQRAVESGSLAPGSDRGARAALNVSRYRSFNFNSVLTYGTVEFRAHGGCLTPFMMRCWIAVGQAVVQMSKNGETFTGPQTVQGMLDRLVELGLLKTEMRTRFVKRTEQIAQGGRAAA